MEEIIVDVDDECDFEDDEKKKQTVFSFLVEVFFEAVEGNVWKESMEKKNRPSFSGTGKG